MKKLYYVILLGISILMFSCVSTKKYALLNSDYQKLRTVQKDCEDETKKLKNKIDILTTENNDFFRQNKVLADQVEYLKLSHNQVLNTMKDMSVLSTTLADNMKESINTITQTNAYIKNLHSAIERKDSFNLLLVTNLKRSFAGLSDSDINMTVVKGAIFIDISDKLLFNNGQYTVSDNANQVLSKLANVLNAHPGIDLTVEGHTDSIPYQSGSLIDNWDLSVKRATSVVRILQEQYNISPKRLSAAGLGKFDPIASNASANGRALNRRTRIIIMQ